MNDENLALREEEMTVGNECDPLADVPLPYATIALTTINEDKSVSIASWAANDSEILSRIITILGAPDAEGIIDGGYAQAACNVIEPGAVIVAKE